MDPAVLAANIRRIRLATGKHQGEVAQAAGLSRVGYRLIESGATAPRLDSITKIAEALGVAVGDLLTSSQALRAVRFRAARKMHSRSEILADVARWLEDYRSIEELLEDLLPFSFAPVRSQVSEMARGDARAKLAADLARKAVGISPREAIRDICGLLENHGAKVLTPTVASEGFFGLSVADDHGGPGVVVNTWDRLSVERWIFTAAHELGHLLLHLGAYDVAETLEDPVEEKEADVFGSYFLMPEGVFNDELREARGLRLVHVVFKLKRIFRVSWKSVLYRISSRSPEGGKLWGRFQWEYRQLTGRTLGKTDEPEGIAPEDFRSAGPAAKKADEPEHLLADDFVKDRLHRLVRRAVEEKKLSIPKAAKVLGIDAAMMRELAASWVDSGSR
jgi:Zn-dependent peptidase ImmA (M78 family)/DNA-binding XRE family transcriptional regulator